MGRDNRRAIRLKIENGLAVLRVPGTPPFVCKLADLSESGCRCCATYSQADTNATEWIKLLVSGFSLEAMISRPPVFSNVVLFAEVAHSRQAGPGEHVIGLRFMATIEQKETLRGILLSCATTKLHRSGSALMNTPPPGGSFRADSTPAPASRIVPRPDPFASKPPAPPAAAPSTPPPVTLEHGRTTLVARKANELLQGDKTISPLDLAHNLSVDSKMSVVSLSITEIPIQLRKIFSPLTMQRFNFVPIGELKETLNIAAAYPLSARSLNELEKIAGRRVHVVLAPIDQIQELRFKVTPRQSQRHFVRVQLQTPIHYQFCDSRGVNLDDQMREGIAFDMSEGGALVLGPAEQAYNAEDLVKRGIHARVALVFQDKEVVARMLVKHIDPNSTRETGLPWAMGMEISQMDAESRIKLKDIFVRSALDKLKLRKSGF